MHENNLEPIEKSPSLLPQVHIHLKECLFLIALQLFERICTSGEEFIVKTEPPQWQKDEDAPNCTRCHSEFTLLWRRVPFPALFLLISSSLWLMKMCGSHSITAGKCHSHAG